MVIDNGVAVGIAIKNLKIHRAMRDLARDFERFLNLKNVP